jgi:glycosyltransferase involved in cell wall biosynthesis
MRNILYIAPDLSVKGGISTVIKEYLRTELPKRHRIVLVSTHVDGTKFRKLAQAAFGLIKMMASLTLQKIDIVHIHGGDIVSISRKLVYFRLARLFECKIIFHFHGASFLDQYSYAPELLRNGIARMFEKADLVICLSESWNRAVHDIAPSAKVKVIFNSINLPALQKTEVKCGNTVQIVFLGLIGERKGVFDLLEVVKCLIDDNYKVNFSIAGNGDTERLISEINRMNICEQVKYLGWINEQQRDALFRGADIFVLPSYAEGMPMSILEAMSYCLPIISTPVGGIPELVVDGETGFLVEPGDLQSLFEKITDLVTNKAKRDRFGQQGRRIIEQKYDINKNVNIIDDIYNRL